MVISPHEASAALHELVSGFRILSPLHSRITFMVAPSGQQQQQQQQPGGSNRRREDGGSGGSTGLPSSLGSFRSLFLPPPGVEFVVRQQQQQQQQDVWEAGGASCPWAWLQEAAGSDTQQAEGGGVGDGPAGALAGVDAVVVLRRVLAWQGIEVRQMP